ncbi:hypothetical protein OEW28_08485 [Defluviimonas sp. WL0002]|uniref:Anti-sigma factor NepR domain-containing protein n=1 Tax=Albidovulum marisflavi TaxID=2984159 RepID=A0ABT2ZBZ0_9RHOB|nr:hypothetical protein [Defluviimonas sp. WL0002]MCV2868663.1 hypothetical protein [Defluviimonas sp. WL0002]
MNRQDDSANLHSVQTLDEALLRKLSEIEQEQIPERLLELARELQDALRARNGKGLP